MRLEKGVCQPQRGDIQAKNQLLDVLFDLLIGQMISPDKRRQKVSTLEKAWAPANSALHRADIVDHMQGGRLQVFGWVGMNLIGHMAEALSQQIFPLTSRHSNRQSGRDHEYEILPIDELFLSVLNINCSGQIGQHFT